MTAARPGTVNFELDVQKEHTASYPLPEIPLPLTLRRETDHASTQNRLGTLHGGTIASMGVCYYCYYSPGRFKVHEANLMNVNS